MLLKEIKQGNYVIVSAIGAISKPDPDEVGLLHDCSMSESQGLNNYLRNVNHFQFKCTDDAINLQCTDDAINLLRPGYFMATIELNHACHSVPIQPHNEQGAGLKWKGSVLELGDLLKSSKG